MTLRFTEAAATMFVRTRSALAVTLTRSFVAMAQLAQAALKDDLWWAVTF